jgi:hypothetical protein
MGTIGVSSVIKACVACEPIWPAPPVASIIYFMKSLLDSFWINVKNTTANFALRN